MSFYLPRERKGPGYYEAEAEISSWWEKNQGKFWNPAMGLYDDSMFLEKPLDEPATDVQTKTVEVSESTFHGVAVDVCIPA